MAFLRIWPILSSTDAIISLCSFVLDYYYLFNSFKNVSIFVSVNLIFFFRNIYFIDYNLKCTFALGKGIYYMFIPKTIKRGNCLKLGGTCDVLLVWRVDRAVDSVAWNTTPPPQKGSCRFMDLITVRDGPC